MSQYSLDVLKVAEAMVESLKVALEQAGKSPSDLDGMTYENFNGFLDKLFGDGGEVRCDRFADLAWGYAGRFGPLGSDKFEAAQHKCIKAAIVLLAFEEVGRNHEDPDARRRESLDKLYEILDGPDVAREADLFLSNASRRRNA